MVFSLCKIMICSGSRMQNWWTFSTGCFDKPLLLHCKQYLFSFYFISLVKISFFIIWAFSKL